MRASTLLCQAHKVELNDDGVVVSIGNLWQLQELCFSAMHFSIPPCSMQGRAPDGSLEFRASSTRENMEYLGSWPDFVFLARLWEAFWKFKKSRALM